MTKRQRKKQQFLHRVTDNQLLTAHYYMDEIAKIKEGKFKSEAVSEGMIDKGKCIFSIDDVNNALSVQSTRSTLKQQLEAMLDEGNWRAFALVNDSLLDKLMTLPEKFPNFRDVIMHYQKTLLLATLTQPAIVYLQPILLVGAPGIGKTRFLRELANVLAVDFFQIDMATTSAGFVLAGSSTSWTEGKPGFVSNSLRQSKVANPLLLIDEIDKVSEGNYNPIGCLYSLLERETAKSFQDEALTVAMDFSDVNWVASANVIDNIPAPIRSRMKVFNVNEPSIEQMSNIAQSVYQDLLAENSWGSRFHPTLDEDVLKMITVASPRDLKRILFDAVSETVFRQRKKLADVLHINVGDIVMDKPAQQQKRMGFL